VRIRRAAGNEIWNALLFSEWSTAITAASEHRQFAFSVLKCTVKVMSDASEVRKRLRKANEMDKI
jgi:hypothetical protein